MANRERIITEDGSHSYYMCDLGESYHSVHGAIRESRHVFIDSGLKLLGGRKEINILEMGFGTGLNALLSMIFSIDHKVTVNYETVELYPLDIEEARDLNYPDALNFPRKDFLLLHQSGWGKTTEIIRGFNFLKIKDDISTYAPVNQYDLVFFDAFSSDAQSHLWEKTIFMRLFEAMNYGGILTTYSAKGSLRRILLDIGFKVEKIPGPPGKRHITRAKKV